MKKFFSVCICLIILLTSTVHAANIPAELEAKSAILFDSENNRVLWQKNGNEKLPVASTTKIMTAILAIENCNVYDVVTVSKTAASMPPSKMYLKSGEQVYLMSLLYALMLESSNDAAVAIAEHVKGSEAEFAKLMNQKAKEIGATSTNFVTASGLDMDVNCYSTAHDMALITSYALQNKIFRSIISTQSTTFASSLSHYNFKNQNKFLTEYTESIGGKTGYTRKANHCYVGAFESKGKKLVCVVLGSSKDGKWIDAKKLITYGFNDYAVKNLTLPKLTIPVLSDNKVHALKVEYKNPIRLTLNEDEAQKIKVTFTPDNNLKAPLNVGQSIGTIKFEINDNTMTRQLLLTDNTIIEE